MPIKTNKDNEGCYAQWGNSGKKYYYECGNEIEMNKAKEKAHKQGVAIGDYSEKTYNDYPKQATENAKIALRWAEENGWGSCGTQVGKQRANQLANREKISRDTIARMASFERHRQNSQKELGDGCGRLMWLAWGGDEGIEWAKRKLEQIDKLQKLSIQINSYLKERVSFDYDGTLTTKKGKELVKKYLDEGYEVYIISARNNKNGMVALAMSLGIKLQNVYATGSNKEKIKKIKQLNISTHYDNNPGVVNKIKGIGKLI